MSKTKDFLKKTSELEVNRDYIVYPININKKKDKLKFVKIAVLVAYLFSLYALYDIYQMKSNSYTIVRNFLDVDGLVSEVEKTVTKLLNTEKIAQEQVKSEEEIVKEVADKSIKLPDLNSISNNIPQNNNINTVTQMPLPQGIPELTMSRYDFFVKKAREFELLGNYRYAIFFYLRAFAEKQSDYTLKYKIATLYRQIGQDELAMESAKDAIKIKPDYLQAIELLVDIYNKTGKKTSGLIEILEKAKNIYPNNKDIKYALAKLYKENGDNKAYEEIMASIKE